MAVCRFLATSIAFFLLCVPALVAQEPLLWKLGGRVGIAAQYHTASFSSFPPISLSPNAPPFSPVSGVAFTAAIEAQYRVLPWLYAGMAGDVRSWKSVFTSTEPIVVNGVPATSTHELSGIITSVGITPSLHIPLFANASADAGVRISLTKAGEFTKTEHTSSGEFVFPRTIGPIAVENVRSIGAELSTAVRYTIPWHGRFSFVPEVRFYTSLTSLRSDVPWNFRGIQAGVGVVYGIPAPPVVVRDTVYQRDTVSSLVAGVESERIILNATTTRQTQAERDGFLFITEEIAESYTRAIPKPAPLFVTAVDVKFVQKDGTETGATTISIEEIIEKQYVPLLPYVFFDEGSSALPKRYTQGNMDTSALPNVILETYYSMVDTIGARMQVMPSAVLNLTGCNANTRGESNNLALSLQRAETVRSYLIQRWSIEPHRIAVQAQNLPANAAAPDRESGMEENRRVELVASDNRILAPVVLADTALLADPPRVRFYPDITSEAGVSSWNIAIQAGGKSIKTFSGEEQPPAMIEWDIAATPAATVLLGDTLPMVYALAAVDKEGYISQTQQGSIYFKEAKRNTLQLVKLRSSERFSLVLFDFGTADLTEENKQTVKQVRRSLSPQHRVLVVGSTDATGSEEYNQQLSLRRAQAIARLLHIPDNDVQGIGVDGDSFPQSLPEGRLYSRRVEILLLPQ